MFNSIAIVLGALFHSALAASAVPRLVSNPWSWHRHHQRKSHLTQGSSYKFEERHFDQRTDHFSAYRQNTTFKQRYLLDKTHWAGAASKAPIFFMTGAEGGDIEIVSSVYGHIKEMSKNMEAMVVFMEGRYFGKSRPFGENESYQPEADKIGFLTVEQMLLDYVRIISSVRDEFDPDWACPTLTFGGSLAGSLAAMMRLKYSNVVDMALASSAPLWGYPLKGFDRFSWRRQITENWKSLAEKADCTITPLVRKAFLALQNRTPEVVQKAFNTCEEPYEGNGEDMQAALWQLLEGEGEFVYPSESSPIPEICRRVKHTDDNPNKTDLDMVAAFFNLERRDCFNLTRETELTPDNLGWEYLSCTEVVNPIGCNNETDFFPPYYWSVEDVGDYCQSRWNVTPIDKGLWVTETFGFKDNRSELSLPSSHILFTYGELDPWHSFAVGTESLSSTLPVIHIKGASHCSDMLGHQDGDTREMKDARAYEEKVIREWVQEIQGASSERRQETRQAALVQIQSQVQPKVPKHGGMRTRLRRSRHHHLALHH